MKNLVKTSIAVSIIAYSLTSCNQSQQSQLNALRTKDSLTMQQMEQKDSSILAYIRTINSIQQNIDTLMTEGKILKINAEKKTDTSTIISELKAIGALILKDQKEIVGLGRKLKADNTRNQDLVDLGENLSKELDEKDAEIAVIQSELGKTKASLGAMVNQFNDSLEVIMQQRNQIGIMQIQGNTVYYVVGDKKDLKEKGIITETGGIIGIGRVPELSSNANNADFISADLTQLKEIPLSGRFVKLITDHPASSYKVAGTTPDKLIITDATDFWSKSKYLVILVK